jgi:hypothetical protein
VVPAIAFRSLPGHGPGIVILFKISATPSLTGHPNDADEPSLVPQFSAALEDLASTTLWL